MSRLICPPDEIWQPRDQFGLLIPGRQLWGLGGKCCLPACDNWCSDTPPDQYQVVMAGIGPTLLEPCDECNSLNGTYVCDLVGGTCTWKYRITDVCSTDWDLFVYFGGFYYLTVALFPDDDSGVNYWRKSISPPIACASLSGESLSQHSQFNIWCKGDGTPCTVTAL
jgi:hypothetical protein